MLDLGRHSLLGVRIAAVDYSAAVHQVIEAAQAARSFGLSALAVHGVMTSVFDRVHRYRLNQLSLLVPDGQPVRWALRWLHGITLLERVYGPQLMTEGCPRQEVFVYEMMARLSMPLLAVGAAFAFHSGELPQAPSWMQRRGLEWLYRFGQEPRRLWRRYLYLNPLYLWFVVWQKWGLYYVRPEDVRAPQDDMRYG